MNEQDLEKELQEKGLNAPRLTPENIDAVIDHVDFHIFEQSCLTVCCITLKNGWNVTGESACISPENFDKDVGRRISRKNAREKIWALEGYLLKQHIFDGYMVE